MSVLLEARGLVQQYTTGKSLFGKPSTVRAVDGIDLSVACLLYTSPSPRDRG